MCETQSRISDYAATGAGTACEFVPMEIPSVPHVSALPEENPRGETAPEPTGAPPSSAPAGELSPTAPAPDPLPARLLNEFVYCPRLFYYEYVEGVFVENADTARGAAIHKKVDSGSGAMAPPAAAPAKAKEAGEPGSDGALPLKARRGGPRTGGTGGGGAGGTGDGAANPPKEDAFETIHSRSVTLGSERLGVIAKLDLVEVLAAPTDEGAADFLSACEVCPVDYKAGSPREGEDGVELWDTDRMQLGLQILVLRENGYRCERGIIYYRGTKQRVPLEMTAALEEWICSKIAEARGTASGPIPPPLAASPKCVRCSLNCVCLPDETRLLRELVEPVSSPEANAPRQTAREAAAPRRLIAPRDERRVLHLNTPGLRIGCSEEVLVVKESDKIVEKVRAGDVAHVALFGNIQISTQAVQMLCEKEIPISYFSMGGWFYGITRGHELKNVFTRIEQFRQSGDSAVCLALARRFVHGKIRNHRTLLMRNHIEAPAPVLAKLKVLADSALEADSLETLLGTEGAAANFYFGQFAGMLKPGDEPAADATGAVPMCFNFSGRNRRPPTDPVNALLSLAYSLLAKDCALCALAVGLDPYVGFYHQPRFGRPALALDLMEEFRPLIAESVVITAINNRQILPKHFVQAGAAVNLSAAGRKLFFQVYEQRMGTLITHPVFDYKASYRRVLELQFRLLARFLTGEIPQYVPFVTR